MPGNVLYVVSQSDAAKLAVERAASALGWSIGNVATHSPAHPMDRVQLIETSLSETLPRVEYVANIWAACEVIPTVERLVRGMAAEFGCQYVSLRDELTIFSDTKRRTAKDGPTSLCLIVHGSPDAMDASVETTELITMLAAHPSSGAIPYLDLYKFYFSHIQHEAAWVNSRFMWFMFASSALVTLFATATLSSTAWTAIVMGLLLSLLIMSLQWQTLQAEEAAIRRCDYVIDAWKRGVPQIRNYLHDTPAGCGDRRRHVKAKWLMLGIIALFILLWVVLLLLESLAMTRPALVGS